MNVRGHSKSMFARNFQFLTPPSHFSFLFVLHVPPPSTYVTQSKRFRVLQSKRTDRLDPPPPLPPPVCFSLLFKESPLPLHDECTF